LVIHALVVICFAFSILDSNLLIALDAEVDRNVSSETNCIELVRSQYLNPEDHVFQFTVVVVLFASQHLTL
jgi:hypothetical protein